MNDMYEFVTDKKSLKNCGAIINDNSKIKVDMSQLALFQLK